MMIRTKLTIFREVTQVLPTESSGCNINISLELFIINNLLMFKALTDAFFKLLVFRSIIGFPGFAELVLFYSLHVDEDAVFSFRLR